MSPGLLGMVVATALGAARLLPVIWTVTPLGGPRLPATVRVGFALLLALVASPALVAAAGGGAALADVSAPRFMLLLSREIVVGLCLALVASAAFRAAEVAGRLGDTLRGANVAEILVPTAEERASPLGVLYLLPAIRRSRSEAASACPRHGAPPWWSWRRPPSSSPRGWRWPRRSSWRSGSPTWRWA
jgi:type III secretory pathway component EscT